MAWIGALVGGAVGLIGSSMQADAAGDATAAQVQASAQQTEEWRRQFDAIQKLLAPYVNAGGAALKQQGNLAGLNGDQAQAKAIGALQKSPAYTSLLKSGTDSILANASATGGLRGGNVQSALGQFAPALLAQVINDQYSRLGGLTSLGQNSAVGVGNAGLTTGAGVSDALAMAGAARAGGALAQGQIWSNALTGATGLGLSAMRPNTQAQPYTSSYGWTGMDWAF